MTEFNLSKKVFVPYATDISPIIWAKDVKEFIRRLKDICYERIDFLKDFDGLAETMLQKAEVKNLIDNIDKLAGDKLVTGKSEGKK